ncbi:MAG: outer membrane protein OmpK, partial [Fusobacteriaceae bacterium]
EVVPVPVVTVEPTVAIVEKESETVAAPVSKDFKFVNFSLMHGNAMTGFGPRFKDTYLELEVGGRKGAFDFYGYIDISDILENDNSSDLNAQSKKNGSANFFAELMPRLSINDLTNTDLSFGPVKELYLTGYLKAGDTDTSTPTQNGLFVYGAGLGSDIQVPWLGTMGLNAYALYIAEDFGSSREKSWNGYLVKNNWFKPFYFFDNGTFLSYQGYMAYQFNTGLTDSFRSNSEFQWYNGLYWHTSDFALGYGLKYTKDMIAAKDGETIPWNNEKIESTGFSNFFAVTYKF